MGVSIDEVLTVHGATLMPKTFSKIIKNLKVVKVTASTAKLLWNNPKDTLFSGVAIIQNNEHIPTSITDGTLIYKGEGDVFEYSIENNTEFDSITRHFDISFPSGGIAYISVFSYTTIGVFSEKFASVTVNGLVGTVYGFEVDESQSDPYDMVTYIGANASYTPARNTQSRGSDGGFEDESWLTSFPFNAIKPCTLNADGTFNKYVNPNDYTLHVDGTSTADMNIFVEIPPIYFFIERINTDIYTVLISDVQASPNFKALAHCRGDELKGNLYIGAYQGTIDDLTAETPILESKSGKALNTSTKLSIKTLRDYARNNGSGFELYNYTTNVLIIILHVLLFKTLDSQASGNGFVYSGVNIDGDSYFDCGRLDTAGMYYGDVGSNQYPLKTFGIEHLWGNIVTFLDGLYLDATANKAYINDNVQRITIGTNATEYKTFPYICKLDLEADDDYIGKVVGNMEGFFLPATIGGSSTTKYCDTCTTQYTYPIPSLAGRVGTKAGIFRAQFYYSITGTATATGRLIYLAP